MKTTANMKPGQSYNMYQVPGHYVAERRNPTTGDAYFVPVCSRAGQSWGTRHQTRDGAETAILEAGFRVIALAGR
jgi:hypothetical protein